MGIKLQTYYTHNYVRTRRMKHETNFIILQSSGKVHETFQNSPVIAIITLITSGEINLFLREGRANFPVIFTLNFSFTFPQELLFAGIKKCFVIFEKREKTINPGKTLNYF